jgi:hypothetical protein
MSYINWPVGIATLIHAIVEVRTCHFLPYKVQELMSRTTRLNSRKLYINVF